MNAADAPTTDPAVPGLVAQQRCVILERILPSTVIPASARIRTTTEKRRRVARTPNTLSVARGQGSGAVAVLACASGWVWQAAGGSGAKLGWRSLLARLSGVNFSSISCFLTLRLERGAWLLWETT